MASWRTTVSGVLLSLSGVFATAHSILTSAAVTELIIGIGAVLGGIGLVNARDDKVSSEQAKAE